MTRGAFVAMRRLGEALAVLAVLGFAAPAAADVLVSNIDLNDKDGVLHLRGVKQAQGFTTGSNGSGYTLNSVDLEIGMSEDRRREVTVQLATGLKAGAKSYTVVATLTNLSSDPDRSVNRFTAPSGTVLDANTKYWVVAAATNPKRLPHMPPIPPISFGRTLDSGETGKFGWSLDDNRLWMGPSGRWLSPSSIPMFGIGPGVVELRVNGTERASSDPVLTMSGGSAVTEGTAASFTVTSDRAPSDPLTVNLTVSDSAGSDFVASSDEGSQTVTIPANATTATYLVTTQADSVVEPHGSVAVRLASGTGYTVGTNSGASVAVHEATPPPLPATGLTASHSSATAIGLAWTLPTQLAGVTVSGHEVQQQSAGSWTTVASLGADATSHTVTGLTNGTSYTFRVRVSANHGSADSETASLTALAPPKPATGLTFSNVTADTVDLSWTLPEQGEGVVVTRMEVHGVRNRPDSTDRREFTDDQWGRALGLDTTSTTRRAYHGGIVHDFRVRLFTNTGIADSEVASWSSPLARPKSATDLSFSNVTATSVDLSWTLPEQGEGVVVSAVEVLWEEEETDDSYYYWNSETLAGDAVSHTVTGLKGGTNYVFRVRVVANSGNAISREEDQWTVDGVSGVAVVSDAGADDTYALGEEIQIRVSFTDMVRVYTEGGIPRLKIDMDPGPGGEKWAAYESGDYTSELTFVHTVVEPDISTQGIAVLADTLEANGATIWRYTGYHADLSHDGLGHDAAHKVDWRLSPQPPEPPPPEAVSAVAVVSDPGADATYAFRDTIRIRVRFGEAMDVTGAPRLKIALRDGDSGQRWAVYEGGSGTDSLTFAYIVAELDSTGRGTAVLANTLELNGGTIRSAATGTDADLSHDGLDKDPAHQVDWFHSAADAEVTSHPASGDLYGPGETIRIKVTFSEAVDVTGAPRQAIDLVPFGDGGEAWAAYEGGSGTPSLTFVYTVAESDTSERGLAVSNLLELNGGTIRWTATQADVPVANLDGKAGVLHHGVYQYDTRVDPGVQAVYVVSRPASGDTYDVGETIRLEVSFTEEVDVTGMPRLKIKMDPEGAEKWADYEGIPGSWRTNQEFRTFTYTVAEPDVSTQGIAVLANSLELNGGTIKTQATGTDVDLAHDGEDHDPAQKVNWLVNLPRPLGVGPLLELLGSGGDTYRDTYGLGETIRISVGFSEDVLVAGTPRLKIKMDPEGAEKWATYEGSATGTLLDFAYTVVEPDISTQGIAVLANTLELNGGLIWSAGPGGELADLSQHVGQGHSPLHKVDWTLTPGSNLLVKGELAILGVAQVGETLTARSVGVMDGDGMAGAKYFYQWMSNDGTADSDIAGAIGENYTIAAADAGRTIKVRASFTDDKGNSETLTSAATAAVSARPLTASFEGLPEAHDGRKRFGFEIRFSEEFRGLTLPALKRALAVTGGRLIDAKRTVPGQNRSVRVRVRPSQSGALTLALAAPSDCTAADAICASDGRKLSNAVTATVRGPAALVSNAAATGSPTITGTAKVGETLTASTAGISDADGLANAAFAFQWVAVRDGTGTDIVGATASSYTLADADAGAAIKVRVSFTDDAGNAEALTSAATVPVALPPLTAAFHGMPAEHDGRKLFAFEIRFSEEFEGLKLTAFKAGALQVTDGRLVDAKRTVPGKNRSVTVRVRPTSFEDMEISLPATADCSAAAAICTKDGRKLSTAVAATVRGPAALTVADAEANEGTDEAVEFAVSLSRAASGTVTVDYATRDGTAKAGEDYTRTRGTLTFAEGELEKTVLVPILDDAIDEGAETFTLKLMNARGAAIADGEATGTIENSDPLQKMWLSRFGRTVASHVTEAVSDRLAGPLAGGQVTVAGQSVDLARSKDEAWVAETVVSLARALGASEEPSPEDEGWPGSGTGGGEFPSLGSASERSVSGRELLLGSTFHLTREGDGGGPGLAAWGRVTVGGFDGEAPAETGNVGIEGEVTTGILGTDAEWDRLLAGVAVSLSEGEGTFAQSGVDSGTIESTLTTVSPYARVMVSERVSTWGLLGFGTGDMTIVQAANDRGQSKRVTRTDIGMRMAALGGRGALLQADDTGGLDLALKTDAFFVETESEAVSNEGSTTADASRLRLILEGSRAFETGGGGVLTPGLELGLRHDGGDAETGTGVELGGRVSYADAGTGLSLEASVRTLIAHEASGYEEWGASGAVRLAPGASGRGLSFRLAPTWGTPSSGAERLWSARDARALAPDSEFTPERRLEGELGYGLSLFGDRFTGTPNVGFGLADSTRDYTLGWRLTRARGDLGFEVNLDATRRETTGGNAPPEHGVMLRGAIRW